MARLLSVETLVLSVVHVAAVVSVPVAAVAVVSLRCLRSRSFPVTRRCPLKRHEAPSDRKPPPIFSQVAAVSSLTVDTQRTRVKVAYHARGESIGRLHWASARERNEVFILGIRIVLISGFQSVRGLEIGSC